MSYYDKSFGFPVYRYADRWSRWALSIATLSLVVASGCGFGTSVSLPQASVEIIRGKDSAGAAIELEKHGDDLTKARVIDVVLGTGEAEIVSTTNGEVEFTIEFPAGATITYIGLSADNSAAGEGTLSGTWRLNPGGVFGSDVGTWEVSTPTNHEL